MFLAADGMPRTTIILLILGCMVAAQNFCDGDESIVRCQTRCDQSTHRRASHSSRKTFTRILSHHSHRLRFSVPRSQSGFWIFAGNFWPVLFCASSSRLSRGISVAQTLYAVVPLLFRWRFGSRPVMCLLAVKGSLDLAPILMFATVFTWTAGFDIIYACQDYESDRATGVFSVPAKIGLRPALWVARDARIFFRLFF